MAWWQRCGKTAYVVCNQCGNSIYINDPENFMAAERNLLKLRCCANCCGVADWYAESDAIAGNLTEASSGTTLDVTNEAWLEF